MRLLATDEFFRVANYAEAVLWIIAAGIFGAFAARRRGAPRRRCLLATAAFFLFGLSDVVEVRTGAWWRPWWLFAWKTLCVLGMIWLLWQHLGWRRKAT